MCAKLKFLCDKTLIATSVKLNKKFQLEPQTPCYDSERRSGQDTDMSKHFPALQKTVDVLLKGDLKAQIGQIVLSKLNLRNQFDSKERC